MADMTTKILTVELKADNAINGIVNLNNAISKNTDQIKANNDMIAKNNKAMKDENADVMKLTAQNQQLAQSNAELAAKTKVLKDERRVLQKETQNEIKMQVEEEGSLKALTAELAKAKQEFYKLGREERDTGEKGKFLKEQINLLTSEIKEAEFGIQHYYRNVGNYEQAILNTIGLNGRWGQSIINITNMQGGFGGAMSAMGASVKAFGATLMGLLTNPVFLAIAGIAGVGMAFKWFYDYNEGLAEASRLTSEFTGLQGEQMQAFRNKVQATADVMGKDFKETLQASDALMSNFHIDGEQAMDAINKGFAAGADVNGDYLAKIQQYAPTFHDAGISAEQLVAIMSQTKSGIFTDQGLDAIKQGSTRIREMSTTTKQALQGIGIDVDEMQAKLRGGQMETFEAMQQVSAKLKELPDNAQEVGEVMSAVFGRQGKFASQEMIEGLADMSTSLDEVKDKTGEYGDLLLENIDTEEELNNVTSALFDMTDNGWENIKQQATIYAKKALVAVVKALIDVANWFIKLYNSSLPVRAVFNGFVAQMKILWSAAKTAFNLIIDGFKAIGRGISAIVNMFSQAGNAISAFGEGIYLMFNGIMNRSLADIKKGWNILKSGVKGAVKSTMDGFVNALTGTWSEASADVGAFFTDLGNIAMDAISNTMNGRIDEIRVPALISGGGGGGGSNNTNLNNNNNNNNNGGSKNKRTGGGKTGGKTGKTGGKSTGSKRSTGGGSKRSTGSGKRKLTDAEKDEQDYQKRIDDLIKKGEQMEAKALEERAKKNEADLEKWAKEQRDLLVKLYGDKAYLQARLEAATTDKDKKKWNDAIKYFDKMNEQIDQAVVDGRENIKKNTEKMDAERAKKAAEAAKQLNQLYIEMFEEGSDERLALQHNLLDKEEQMELDALEERKKAELEALKDDKEAQLKVEEQYEDLKNATIAKYNQKNEQLDAEHHRKQLQLLQTYAETMMAGVEEYEQENLDWRLKSLQYQLEQELSMYEGNEAMKEAIRAKYQQLELQARRDHTNAVIALEQQKYEAISTIVGGFGQIFDKFAEDNKEAAMASKVLALGEIMISQAVAIANAVEAGSNAANPWQMIAQIAASVTAVVVAMADAFNSLNKAKFATGGYIRGAGTGTSDSIPIRVSNGESVMNAQATAMFGGLLSSLNQLGGGVPIQAQETAASVRGEEMLARAFARGVAMLPNPVVSVEDINRGQRQVEVMNERATL